MNSTAPKQYFTLEDANKRLPLVKSIVSDIVSLASSVVDRRERLERLKEGRQRSGDDVYSEELEKSSDELQKDMDRLQGFVDELQALGVELKDLERGLVDFPTKIDGRGAYLCWKPGEDEIAYWHEADAGFAGRKSLLEGMITGESFQGSSSEDS